jgi:hypothetical protein
MSFSISRALAVLLISGRVSAKPRSSTSAIDEKLPTTASSAQGALISPRSAIQADTCPTSSKPSPIPAERTDRDRFVHSCARGVPFAP